MPDERTFEDFMDDMISNCRTPIEIWIVAKNTRWAGQADEAQRIAEKRAGKKIHKKM